MSATSATSAQPFAAAAPADVPPPETTARARFTLDGDAALESHLAQVCRRVRGGVKGIVPTGRLEGILLGGGYGRGEGGVFKTENGDQPYNDLEYYVLIRGPAVLNERRYRAALETLAHELSAEARIEVEFKILSLARLRSDPATMFSYDLVRGHRWVLGQENLLQGCDHHTRAGDIPLAEVTRLLMNRCSGLLFARERLGRVHFRAEDADFVGRNLAKARLALGDAVLAACGRYHWSCRERARRLAALEVPGNASWKEAVRSEHRLGVEFKLHPRATTSSVAVLMIEWRTLAQLACRLWLWVEQRRLGVRFRSPIEYADHPAAKCPGHPPLRNLAVNVRRFGFGVLRDGPTAFRYPRERMLRSLPLLLWEPAAIAEPRVRAALQRDLRTSATDWNGFVAAYTRVWENFR
jgi:hypothetical protein